MSKTLTQPPALTHTLTAINRKFGEGSIQRLGDATHLKIETFSTGFPQLDEVLGGGLPKGRLVEIYGSESAGKTTLALHALA